MSNNKEHVQGYLNNSDYDLGEEPDKHWIMVRQAADLSDYVLFGFNFFSILANFYIMWASRRLFRKSAELTHLLVFSMTTADVIICIIHQVRTVLIRLLPDAIAMHPALYIALMAFTWISFSASGFSLFLLNVEKIIYFHWPLQYANYLTYRKTLSAVGLCWILCLGYAVLMLASANYSCDGTICIVPNQTIYQTYVVLFCIVPVISSGVLSLYLYLTIRTKRRQTHTPGNISLRQQLRTMAFIFTATAWVVLSWIPARIHFILFLEDGNVYALWYGVIANFLLMVSPMVHPFITVIVYPCYRRLTMKLLKCFKRRKNSVTTYRSVKTSDVVDVFV